MSLSNNYPTIRPTLEFDFANVGALDPRITFTRATSATFVNQLGVIQTAASGIPRFDYDPSTFAARGLLIEEQRTNLLTYSEEFTNVAWTNYLNTINSNSAVAPDGTSTAETIIPTTNNDEHAAYQANLTLSTGTPHTLSCFFKASGYNFGFLRSYSYLGSGVEAIVMFNLSTGAVGNIVGSGVTATITPYGNGWYRCTMTHLVNVNGTSRSWQVGASPTNASSISFAGNGTSGVIAWGAQLEAGSFATSYIPTVASTVTRNADAGTLVSLSPWYNGTEGSFYLETNSVQFTNPTYFFVQTGVTNTTAFSFNGTYWGVLNENIAVTDPSSGVAANQNSIDKIAYSYGSGSASISVRASAPVSASRTLVPFTSIAINNQLGSAHLRRMAFYPKKLSDAQLQALTS